MQKALLIFALSAGLGVIPATARNSQTTKDAQQALKDKGLYDGPIDGIYGPQTRQAVKSFQEKQNLKTDGRLGPQTMDSLGVKHGTSGTEMHEAGTNLKTSYSAGGKDIGKGGKEMGSDIKHGQVVDAGKDLGKGVGHGAAKIGVGTGHAIKNAAKGVKDGVTGDKAAKDQTPQ